jgi:hypothetical protein
LPKKRSWLAPNAEEGPSVVISTGGAVKIVTKKPGGKVEERPLPDIDSALDFGEKQKSMHVAGMEGVLRKRAQNAEAFLSKHGWKLSDAPIAEGYERIFQRPVEGGGWESLKSREVGSEEYLSYQVFNYSTLALHSIKNNRLEYALGLAFMAGFYHGKSNALFVQKKMKRKARSGMSDSVTTKERILKAKKKWDADEKNKGKKFKPSDLVAVDKSFARYNKNSLRTLLCGALKTLTHH